MVLLISNPLFSQSKKDSSWIGSIHGIIWDSAHDYLLPMASVAVYSADTSLLTYQLSNNLGEFTLEQLPIGVKLKLVIGYVGYNNVTKIINIQESKKNIDLDSVAIEKSDNNLADVVVKAELPMRMVGDTLEFNADAFTIDRNAVAEDLFRKLPGITVWGDGTITVNGKQVNQVLVDGKPFFGNDARIATQNIPKTAIDKIQVYQEKGSNINPLDSITDINIKLKKNQNFGYFGKLNLGLGTNSRYETDDNLNYFNPSTQIGIVGASNNTNKIAKDASTLMKNSTFKGTGAHVEYQPDFSQPGVNRADNLGVVFQKDYIPNSFGLDINRLNLNYFLNNDKNTTNTESQQSTSLGGLSRQVTNDTSLNMKNSLTHHLEEAYRKRRQNFDFILNTSLQRGSDNNSSKGNTRIINDSSQALLSTNEVNKRGHNENTSVDLSVSLAHKKETSKNVRIPGDWYIAYPLNTVASHDKNSNLTMFRTNDSTSNNMYFNRNYNNHNNIVNQNLDAKIGNLLYWITGNRGTFLRKMQLDLENDVTVSIQHINNLISDFDTSKNVYYSNGYLSNRRNTTIIDERPSINLVKDIDKDLSDRYSKDFKINLFLKGQYYIQNNYSSNSIQTIKTNYSKFIPAIDLNYLNEHYGIFDDHWSLMYKSSYVYTNVDQLRPLIDSTNIYNISLGNSHLKPSNLNEITFSFKHNSQKYDNNPFNYTVNAGAGIIHNYFADSTIIDSAGRYTTYLINMNGNKYVDASFNLNKAFALNKSNEIQFSINSSMKISRLPGYIKSINFEKNRLNYSSALNLNNDLSVNYTYKDIIALQAGETWNFYKSKETALLSNMNSNTNLINFSLGINCTKRWTVNTDLINNTISSTGSPTNKFNIWNMSTSYRFFKGNSLELKFSALDLLHENKSVISYGNNYGISHVISNVLEQYFMFTISYFPRKFGNKNKN